MNPFVCQKCGKSIYAHSAASCAIAHSDQLATKLTALESTYAECAEKLYRAEQREHDLKRRLEDMRGQRDRLTTELRRADERTERAEERARQLEASIRECAEWIYWESTNDSREATDVECYQRAVNLLKQ